MSSSHVLETAFMQVQQGTLRVHRVALCGWGSETLFVEEGEVEAYDEEFGVALVAQNNGRKSLVWEKFGATFRGFKNLGISYKAITFVQGRALKINLFTERALLYPHPKAGGTPMVIALENVAAIEFVACKSSEDLIGSAHLVSV